MPVSIRASDLPYHVRQQLLDKLRDAAGDYQYNQLLDRFGEDGLLQMALDAARVQSAPQLERAPSVPLRAWRVIWNFYGEKWWERLLFLFNTLAMGPAGLLLLALLWVSVALYLWARGWGMGKVPAAALAGGSVLLAVGLATGGTLAAASWLVAGVRGWWGWLGSRF